jgi:GMP synthase (glutamine-hydrolysing)
VRTLILDNSVVPVFLREGSLTRRWIERPFQVCNAVRQPLPPHDSFDCLVLTGSEASVLDERPWMKREIDFVSRAVSDGKPVLGICFGHQLLARALWGRERMRRAPAPEFGWRKIRLDAADPLFAGLPREAVMYCSHLDEVIDLPAEALVPATSDQCPVHAFHLRGRAVWGLQFHPEMDRLGGWAILAWYGLVRRVVQLDKASAWDAADGPRFAPLIFANFARAAA